MTAEPTPSSFFHRHRRVILFVLSLAIPVVGVIVLFTNPQITFASVHQVYQQGAQWVETPQLGDPAYDYVVAPDEAVWAMNSGGLYRWDGQAWVKLYSPNAHPTDFTLDGEMIWLVTHGDIVRCDTLTLDCETMQRINEGLSIAAFAGRVDAITRDGHLVWLDDGEWHNEALNTLLPGYNSSMSEAIPKIVYTSDGTLWLKWYQLWRLTDGVWTAAKFGEDLTVGVRLTGATPGVLWTEWNNGLVAALPSLNRWQLFTWEEMQAPGSDWIFDLTSGPDGSIWVAAKNGLLHYDGSAWDLQPLPEEPLVTAVAITPNNTIWAQTTASGMMTWLPLVVFALGSILFVRWTSAHSCVP